MRGLHRCSPPGPFEECGVRFDPPQVWPRRIALARRHSPAMWKFDALLAGLMTALLIVKEVLK